MGGLGHAQHAQAGAGHLVDLRGEGGKRNHIKLAKLGDSFGRTFGGYLKAVVRRAPCLRHRQQCG